VLNAGSSTLKFQVIQTDLERIRANSDRRLASGQLERIGGEAIIARGVAGQDLSRTAANLPDLRAAVSYVVRWLASGSVPEIGQTSDIHAVGHRVVHGGERFKRSVLINDDVMRGIDDCIDLAPLHNPANIRGILAARELLGAGLPQVAVFDTAFHQTLPERAYLYALPYQYYRRYKVRRYGFHGTSHRYVAYRYRTMLGIERSATNVISLHLGNGCSAAAIVGGDSIDTSMGMTPLEGLVMGSRAGDLDPAIIDYLATKEGLALQQVEALLNKQSGLLGISGLTNDMRELLDEARENADRRATLAIEIFCYRARKYVGAYLAATGGADALIFTGGIGENAAEVRSRIADGLGWMGMELDADLNNATVGGREGRISTDGSRLHAYVIPTDEELLIARDTARCVLELS
jgi:acetate kinase